ncbi:hypothetical protein ASG74_02545 [Knoellia sp. Soil729]|nr:hypothetical protein ASG74_02545 [Knoellia sp. Soil729]
MSVVVPVYNPGRHIRHLVASLKAQTLRDDEFEVVFVDDGSTDGTGRWLALQALRHSNFTYRRIRNSGWPGRPRNVGTRVARGEYVVYADNDDVIPPSGLQDMYDYGTRHGSDVVIGRELGKGRVVSKEVFRESVPDARLGADPVLGILTPHKMYRRQFLADHGLAFREGVFRLEDHLFNIEAFFAARRISIYADQPCYVWTKRKDPDGAQNASYNPWVAATYYGTSMDAVLAVVEDKAAGDPELRDRLLAHWYDTKMLMRLTDKRFVTYDEERRSEMYAAIRDLTLRRVPPSVDRQLPTRVRIRSALLRHDRFEDLLPLATAELGQGADITTTAVRLAGDVVEVDIEMRFRYADGSDVTFRRNGDRVVHVPPVELDPAVVTPDVLDVTDDIDRARFDLLVKERDAPEDYFAPVRGTVSLEPSGDEGLLRLVARGTGTIDPALMAAGRPAHGTIDVNARLWVAGWSLIRRVPAPAGTTPGADLSASDGAKAYATDKGNLSIEVPASR